jgi:hypothetical protein
MKNWSQNPYSNCRKFYSFGKLVPIPTTNGFCFHFRKTISARVKRSQRATEYLTNFSLPFCVIVENSDQDWKKDFSNS